MNTLQAYCLLAQHNVGGIVDDKELAEAFEVYGKHVSEVMEQVISNFEYPRFDLPEEKN